MIRRLPRIDDLGVLSGFRWPSDLPSFEQRNLIYGWNYSGKTTLSRLFRVLERGENHPDFQGCRFSLGLGDSREVASAAFAALGITVRVFNSDYVAENLRWREGVAPILILGSESVELEEALARRRSQIARRKRHLDRIRERKTTASRELGTLGTETARRIREDFGKSPFNRSPHLEQTISDLTERDDDPLLSQAAYEQENLAFRAEARDKVTPLRRWESADALQVRVERVLQQTADRVLLEKLEHEPDLVEWV